MSLLGDQQEWEEVGLIDKNTSVGAKHSKLKGLLNSISIAGSDNPLVEVEYKGKHSNVILTTQGINSMFAFSNACWSLGFLDYCTPY